MYSHEHDAKFVISVFAHKYFHLVYFIFTFIFDISQNSMFLECYINMFYNVCATINS